MEYDIVVSVRVQTAEDEDITYIEGVIENALAAETESTFTISSLKEVRDAS